MSSADNGFVACEAQIVGGGKAGAVALANSLWIMGLTKRSVKI